MPGYQMDSLPVKKGLTSMQCKRIWDRLALYVDRDYYISTDIYVSVST